VIDLLEHRSLQALCTTTLIPDDLHSRNGKEQRQGQSSQRQSRCETESAKEFSKRP